MATVVIAGVVPMWNLMVQGSCLICLLLLTSMVVLAGEMHQEKVTANY